MAAASIPVVVNRSVRRQGLDISVLVFAGALLLALLLSLAVLTVLVGTQLAQAAPVFAERGVDFLTSDLSSNPEKAGVAQGLIGTALLVMIVAATTPDWDWPWCPSRERLLLLSRSSAERY